MLRNKIIVVNGGCGLLGQKIIEDIVKFGGIAVVSDLDSEKGEKLSLGNPNIYFKYSDITSEGNISDLIDFVYDKFGKIDAVVNSAYPRNENYGKMFENVTYKDFCENVNLHLGGYFLICKQFSKFFRSQNYGNIINISSVYGVVAPKFDIYDNCDFTMPVEYSAIKSGIIHLTKYIASYYKNCNIRVNCISPGGIKNNQSESFCNDYKKYCLNKGMLDAFDITGTVIFLLSELSTQINGQNIIVDDGFSL